jgi:hypothetical protein
MNVNIVVFAVDELVVKERELKLETMTRLRR